MWSFQILIAMQRAVFNIKPFVLKEPVYRVIKLPSALIVIKCYTHQGQSGLYATCALLTCLQPHGSSPGSVKPSQSTNLSYKHFFPGLGIRPSTSLWVQNH